MQRIFLYILFLFSSHILSAQYYRVEGKIIDGKTGMGLSNSNIELMSLHDTSYHTAESSIDGKFRIYGIKEGGKYMLMVHHLGYANYLKVIDVLPNTNDVGKIKMVDSLVILKESIIKAQRNGLVLKGDTLEYNAKSFKTNTDMDAVYFLSKLPGIDMSGNMKVDGDSVSKVMLNGLICFGEKPKKMLENLPASVIEKIQIFNDLTDEERKTNTKPIVNTKVINIITKGDYFSKPRGKVYAGYASQQLHLLGGNMLLQKADEQISVSINRNKGRIKNNSYFEPSQQFSSSGIPLENELEFEMTKKIHPKVKLNVDADLYQFSNSIISSSITNYNGNSTVKRMIKSNSQQNELNKSASLNFSIEYQIDSFTKCTIRSRQRIHLTKNRNTEEITTFSTTANTLNVFNTSPTTTGSSLNDYAEITRTGKHKKTLFKASFAIWYSPSETENITKGSTIRDDSIYFDFKSNSSTRNFTMQPELSYKLPFLKNHSLFFLCNWNRRKNVSGQQQNNYSILDEDYTIADDRILRQITNTSNLQRVQTNYSFNRKKVKIESNNSLQFFHLQGESKNNVLVDKRYQFINTRLNTQYQFTPLTEVSLNIERERNVPWIDDLNPILNNTNRVFMSIGNINLQPTINYNIQATFKSKHKESGSFFTLQTKYNYVPNPIRQNVLIAGSDTLYYNGIEILPGSQLRYSDNVNPHQYSTQSIAYDFPLKWIKSIIKMRVMSTQFQNNSLVNYQAVRTITNTISPSITVASTISTKLDFTIFGSYDRKAVTQTQTRIIHDYRLNIFCVYEFIKNTFLKIETNTNTMRGLSNTSATTFNIINVSLERNLLKDGRLKIAFLAHDILNSYSNYEFESRTNYTVERYTNGIRRYFLGKINYTF